MNNPSRILIAALAATALASTLSAQAAATPRPNPSGPDLTGVGDTSMFAPLNLPPGNIYRSGSGAPGPKYWQQRADYDLHGTLDTAAKALHGEMTLRYTNNSPDTLRFVWFQVEQNAFKNGSLNSYVFPADSRFGARNFEGGDVIDRFNQVGGAAKKTRAQDARRRHGHESRSRDAARARDRRRRSTSRGTSTFPSTAPTAWVATARCTSSRSGIRASASTTTCAAGTPSRTSARASSISSTATTTSSVTVPAGYIVAATGTLQNAAEVLTPTQISRLAQAAKSETPVHIVTAGRAEERRRAPEEDRAC